MVKIYFPPPQKKKKKNYCYKIVFIQFNFDTRYRDMVYWPCMAEHEPFQMVMAKIAFDSTFKFAM